MKLHVVHVLIILISCVGLSSQSCGSTSCSQNYGNSCPPDESCHIYHNCKTSKSSCDRNMGPADKLSVDCYDTCIVGHPVYPTTPFKCCANGLLVSETISVTVGNGYLIARLYSPNEPGQGVYRHNTFCKYNVQCPNNNYDLHYLMVRFDIEPPLANDKCLDFLRYHFTATGANVDTDACGKLANLSPVLSSGAHGSSLTLDFRSNRIKRNVDFFLSVTCIKTTQAAGRKKRASSQQPNPVLPLGCTPTMSFGHREVQSFSSVEVSVPEYFNKLFSKTWSSRVRRITVTRSGVVMYKDATIYVKIQGRIKYRFRRIRVLQVNNKIEGNLKFIRNASPRTRVFPGYGFLQVGSGTAQYIQTLVNPRFLLSDEEQVIVRDIYQELYNRHAFDAERFYLKAPYLPKYYENVNCSINELARLNTRSCSDVVRAAASFFLTKDNFEDYCT